MAIGLFRLWSLDDGSLIVKCGKCGFHLVLSKELIETARTHTIVSAVEEIANGEKLGA